MQKVSRQVAYQLNSMLTEKLYDKGHAAWFWPHMACTSLCGFPLMRRFHVTCLWCRLRRFFYGKLDRSKYHFNTYLGHIILPNALTIKQVWKRVYGDKVFFTRTPGGGLKAKIIRHMLLNERPTYTLYIDENRRFKSIKDILLNKAFAKMEEYVNMKNLSFPEKLFNRYLYTLVEMLAN